MDLISGLARGLHALRLSASADFGNSTFLDENHNFNKTMKNPAKCAKVVITQLEIPKGKTVNSSFVF